MDEEEEGNGAAEGNSVADGNAGGEENAGGEGNAAAGDGNQNTDDNDEMDLRNVFDDPNDDGSTKAIAKAGQRHRVSIKRRRQ